ncbi:hypothetical protein [Bradyrhizobium sp. SZCCHNS1054]|uniref:hypothetical protein n=1 Tax=Bradyrhizobium sp. SZCCHNS1054 TaxID=3057301 RepID=UPI002916F72D|nr:hypothetical protein [Bradyrhizobium sp. SZCCHNS1054]
MANQANDPESALLTTDDSALFENARQALSILKRSFEHWTIIGHAIVRARAVANTYGGKFTFQRILIQQGLKELIGDKGSLSRLEKIMANLPQVEAWRSTLTERQKIDWAAPNTIFKRCPLFKKVRETPDGERPLSPVARLKQEHEETLRKMADLEERVAAADVGSLFNEKDTVKNMGRVLFERIGARKTYELGCELIKLANGVRAEEARTRRAAAKAGEITA